MARCIAISRICLFSMFVVLLSACGGSGGGGSDSTNDPGNPPPADTNNPPPSSGNQTPPPTTDSVNAYLPTDPAIKWTFNDSLQVGFLPDDVSSGAHVHALTYPTGGKEYFVTGTNQINLQGLYLPTISVGDGVNYTGDIRFNNLLVILQGDSTPTTSVNVSGAGTINISPTYGKHDISFSGTIDYVSDESVSTALGSFTAKRINIDLTLTTTIEGRNFQLPYNVTFWFAKNVGIVKRDQDGVVYLLSSISGLNIGSAIGADPDPATDPGTNPGTGEEPDPGTGEGTPQPPSGSVKNVFITYKNTNTVLSENSSQPVEITVDPNNFTITTPPIPGNAAIRICAAPSMQVIAVGNSISSYPCFQPGQNMAMPSITASGIPLYVSTGSAHNFYDAAHRVDTSDYTALPINEVKFLHGTSLGKFYLLITADKNGNGILDQGELWVAHINIVDSNGAAIGVALTTSISASPTALSFFAHVNSSSPDQDLVLTFAGDTVVADSAPYWLNLASYSNTSTNTRSYSISATGYPAVGTYTSSLKFKTVRIPPSGDIYQATDAAYVSVPITMVVSDFAISAQAINLTAVDGSNAVQQDANQLVFSLSGTAINWSLSSDQAWLTFAQTTGSGPSTATFNVSTSGLSLGAHTATISVQNINTGEVLTFPVTVTVTAPQLTLNPETLSFSVDGNTTKAQLSKSISVSDELNGSNISRAISWRIESDNVPWIASVTPSSGVSAPPSHFTVALNASALETLADGDYSSNITVSYVSKDMQPHTLNVPVNLQLKMPRLQWVAPHVVYAGQQYEIILRGSGFDGVKKPQVFFGSTAAGTATKISDTEIRITYPSTLPAGDIQVRIGNGLDLKNVGSSRLVVRNSSALDATVITATGGDMSNIFYDDERQVLYGVDVEAQRLERFALKNNTWTKLPALLVSNIKDAAISTDGKTLVIVTRELGIYKLDLTSENAALEQVSQSGEFFRHIAFTNQNIAFVTSEGGGNEPYYTYDLSTNELVQGPYPEAWLSCPSIGASADGRMVLIAQNCVSPNQPIMSFGASANLFSATPIVGAFTSISLNRNASRFVANGKIYDDEYNFLGYVDGTVIYSMSPDGKRNYAYQYGDYFAPESILIYDLSVRSGVGSYFSVLTTIPISSTLLSPWTNFNDQPHWPKMVLSSDGLTMFLWGDKEIQVLPLP